MPALRPVRRQTQRRFNSKDGTMPTVVAIMLAHPAEVARVATRVPSTVRLVPVAMAETAP